MSHAHRGICILGETAQPQGDGPRLRLVWSACGEDPETPEASSPEAGPAYREADARVRSLGSPALRALVVEDEIIIAMEIEALLEELGAEVVGTAMSAAEAIELADRLRPDVVTMDVTIRGERDGISAAKEIRERFGIRSVFVSAYTDKDTTERGDAADPIGWIGKPISKSRLKAALRDVQRGKG